MRKIGIPGLTTLSSKSGIGRVIHNLQNHLQEDVILSDLLYRHLDVPILKNFPIGAKDEQLDLVIFPQLTGVRNVKILNQAKKSLAIIHDIGIIDCPLDKGLLNPISKSIIMYDLKCLSDVNIVISVSEFTKDRLVKYYPQLENKICVIKNSLSESFMNFEKSKLSSKKAVCDGLGLSHSSVILLYVGTELPRKNIRLLLDTLAELKKADSRVVLIKAGGSGGVRWRQQTLEMMQERGLTLGKDIFIRDNISEDELLDYYNCATATVLPSLYEGFGLPAIESLALSTPIVAADGSAMNEIASQHNMIHAPTVQAFKNAIIDLIKNGMTELQKTRLISFRSEYSPQHQAEILLELVGRMI